MSWLILVLVWLVISVATATRGFSGGGVECYSDFSSLLFLLWKLLFLDLVIETSWGIGWMFVRLILVLVWVLF